MVSVSADKTDRAGYDEHYKGNPSALNALTDCESYIREYESTRIAPFYAGGHTKGYVRGEAIRRLRSAADQLGARRSDIHVLDAGSGQGELSVYLAAIGFNVVGVDISTEAKACGDALAAKAGVADRCRFLAESLEKISVAADSIDFVIGHASLHHFIKYEGVPGELRRVMKPGARGFFADAFGENRLFSIFHDKEKMQRLGDVSLNKDLVENYFSDFEVRITPTDWFVMLDKLYQKFLPGALMPVARKLSRLHFWLDRRISTASRFALRLSGSVLTEIAK